MTITPLNSKFYAEFDEIIGISRHFHEAQTLNFLRVIYYMVFAYYYGIVQYLTWVDQADKSYSLVLHVFKQCAMSSACIKYLVHIYIEVF